MKTLWQDIRYGMRMLGKSPGFTAIALITLAVGIGANTVMFSISDLLLLLQPRRVKNPQQLTYCGVRGDRFASYRYSEYLALCDSGLAFGDVMAENAGVGSSATLACGDSARRVETTYVSANYFSFLGATPSHGRGFLPEEEQPASVPVAVLSHLLWQRLGGDPNLVGDFVTVNGVRCQVVGVAPAGFTGVTLVGPDLWLPLGNIWTVSEHGRRAAQRGKTDLAWFRLVGRLKPDLTAQVAQAQLQPMISRFKLEHPEDWKDRSSFDLHPPGRFQIEGDNEMTPLVFTLFSLVLMAASIIILVIACLNLANMLIVQGASRHREIAVRLALGGGRWRIIRQLFVESLLLAMLGGGLGVVAAFCGVRILNVSIAAVQNPLATLQPGLNLRVLAATLGFCLLATLLFGLRSALWLSKRDIVGEMKASMGRVRGGCWRKRGRLSAAGQIALAVTLVLSAALLMRSAMEVARPDPRYRLENTLVVQIDPKSSGRDLIRSVQAYEALAGYLASLPEVEAVGTTSRLFYGGRGPVLIGEHRPGEGGSGRPLARENAIVDVGRDYFKAMEIPLLQGRVFDRLDSVPNAEKVAIIDESLARRLRPDGNALGCLIQWGLPELAEMQPDPLRVVGIVANVPGIGDREVHGQIYQPAGPNDLSSYLYLHVADREPMDVVRRRIAASIHRFDPQLPVLSVAMLAEIRRDNETVWMARFGARLALAAGAAALFLAALGIYAIKGYMVASRTPEIGVRMALGATRGSVMGMVLREGLVLTVAGVAVGLLLGLAVARVAASMLYGVSPVDPLSIVVTVALLGAASLLAGCVPARRAAKVDPMTALRCE